MKPDPHNLWKQDQAYLDELKQDNRRLRLEVERLRGKVKELSRENMVLRDCLDHHREGI